jgi:predicted glycosyltransferase
MGAVAGDMLMTVGGLAAGAIAAKQLNKVLKFDARILAAGKVALGVALPKFVKNPFMASVGNGMVAVGATELVGSFIPALAGADDVVLLSGLDEIGELDEMSGMDEIGAMDISEVNGTDINEVNGFDEIGEIEMI